MEGGQAGRPTCKPFACGPLLLTPPCSPCPARQPGNFCTVHVSLVPVIGVVGEQKTKPTQHSVATLRSLGLNPALLACRSSEPLQDSVREKLVSGGGWGGRGFWRNVEEDVCCGAVREGRLGWLARAARCGAAFPHAGVVQLACMCPPPAQPPPPPLPPPPVLQASFCHVPAAQVLTMHDVSNIWRVPLMMQAQVGLTLVCLRHAQRGTARLHRLPFLLRRPALLPPCRPPTRVPSPPANPLPCLPALQLLQGAHDTICRLLGLGGAAKIDTSMWKQRIADKWDQLTQVGGREGRRVQRRHN